MERSHRTPQQRRQIIERKAVNMDQSWSGQEYARFIHCGWADCENYGYECYKVRQHTEKPGYPERILNWIFCCERHRQYFIYSSQHPADGVHGMLPPGARNTL